MVKDKVERSPGELGISKSMECDTFPFRALTLFFWGGGDRKCIRTVKKLGFGLLVVIGALHML